MACLRDSTGYRLYFVNLLLSRERRERRGERQERREVLT
jgi:hypothetical protein